MKRIHNWFWKIDFEKHLINKEKHGEKWIVFHKYIKNILAIFTEFMTDFTCLKVKDIGDVKSTIIHSSDYLIVK